MSEWIFCEKKLPERCEEVLVYYERDAWPINLGRAVRKREIAVGWQIEGNWHIDGCSGEEGIAWMPLPEAPGPVGYMEDLEDEKE